MKKDNHKTKVVFYTIPENEVQGGEVIAVFIEIKERYPNTYLSYMHLGQHSTVHKDFLKNCKLSEKEEYKNLYKELENRGYNLDDLNSKLLQNFDNSEEQKEFIKDYLYLLGHDTEVYSEVSNYTQLYLIIEDYSLSDEFYFKTSEFIRIELYYIITYFLDFYNDNY